MKIPWWWNEIAVGSPLLGYAMRREWRLCFGPWYKKQWMWVVEQIWAIENELASLDKGERNEN
ncbi:MAG: hypothetical protein IPN23_10900 [Elusimicrobia bacterium]|nr:hypothetical protein [Elusimicrobiota bacterium]